MSLKTDINYLKFLLDSGIHTFLQKSPYKYYINSKNGKSETPSKVIGLSDIHNLDELKDFIIKSNVCDLKKNATTSVFSDGNPLSKIMLIGEAPGAEEDKQGKPFVGQAGKLLDKMLAAIGLNRKKVYISNIIPWRPPNNRTPTTDEIIQCLPFVQRHIEIVNPKLLILLGSTATKALMVTNLGITKLRGKWHKYNSIGLSKTILTRAIFHPAFLLRSPDYKRVTWDDLKEIQKEITKNEKI